MVTPTSIPIVSSEPLSGFVAIDSLLSGQEWGANLGAGDTVTYSFRSNDSFYSTSTIGGYGATSGTGEPWGAGWFLFTDAQKVAIRAALTAWSDVADIHFTEVTDSQTVAGDIRFGFTTNNTTGTNAPAWTYGPEASSKAGDVWFDNGHDASDFSNATVGSYAYVTYLHEIGHALGFKHPHDGAPIAPSGIDFLAYTVMSYRDFEGDGINGYASTIFPQTPMLDDIAAIQYLYGPNLSTRTGDDVYSFAVGEKIYRTIYDAGGNDTIDWSNQTSDAVIRLTPGEWSQIGPLRWDGIEFTQQNLTIAYGTIIENANGGSGNDTLVGNDAANVLHGNAGNDTLIGGAGNDDLAGGPGNDTLFGNEGNDRFDWAPTERGGNDTFDGGPGDDTYVLDSLGDNVIERAGEGMDLIWVPFSYSLAGTPYVENLAAFGPDSVNLTGNDLNNVVAGNDASNVLNGGLGNDTLIGGLGRDTAQFSGSRSAYNITKSGTVWTLSGPDGTDTVTGIERLQFADAVIKPGASVTDVNADGKTDIISRPIGEVDIWQMDGSQITASSAWGAGSLWQVPEAHGDYNGDGKSDILLTTIGDVYVWQMNGTQISSGVGFGASSSWHFVGGAGDYNGDGKSDIVLEHDNGTVGIWFMNGTANQAAIGSAGYFSADPSWTIVGTSGDYNGDGKSDFVATRVGQVAVWQMDGANVVDSATFSVSSSLSVIGTRGDYNGDGKSDILLQNHDTGALAIWLMDGTHIIGSGTIDTGHPEWVIAATDADFNDDGKSDLLIREIGEVGVWQMNGTQVLSQANWGASTFWALHAGTADYNADGKSDVVLENPAGDVVQWLMNGVNIDHAASFHITPGTDFLI